MDGGFLKRAPICSPDYGIRDAVGGTPVASTHRMALITMWRRSGRECVIAVVGLRSYTVRLLDHDAIVREQQVMSADDAVQVALQWRPPGAEHD